VLDCLIHPFLCMVDNSFSNCLSRMPNMFVYDYYLFKITPLSFPLHPPIPLFLETMHKGITLCSLPDFGDWAGDRAASFSNLNSHPQLSASTGQPLCLSAARASTYQINPHTRTAVQLPQNTQSSQLGLKASLQRTDSAQPLARSPLTHHSGAGGVLNSVFVVNCLTPIAEIIS